jgi:hypothetical protein
MASSIAMLVAGLLVSRCSKRQVCIVVQPLQIQNWVELKTVMEMEKLGCTKKVASGDRRSGQTKKGALKLLK